MSDVVRVFIGSFYSRLGDRLVSCFPMARIAEKGYFLLSMAPFGLISVDVMVFVERFPAHDAAVAAAPADSPLHVGLDRGAGLLRHRGSPLKKESLAPPQPAARPSRVQAFASMPEP